MPTEDEFDDDRPARRPRNSRDDDDRPARRPRDDDDAPRRGGGKPHRGVMILVLGILGFFCCFILGIVAFFMGQSDIKEMDAGRMDPSGRGLTKAGMIIGLISIVWTLVWVILNFTVFKGNLGNM
jgi:hypothetical protein